MEEVIKNTHAYVDVLVMARGDAVITWEKETFERAFKWARYFEGVYTKLKSKPALAEKLNKYLNNFNKTESVFLGNLKLTFKSLQISGKILKQFLLQNPHISSEQFPLVIMLYSVIIGGANEQDTTVLTEDLVRICQLKGCTSVLTDMRCKLSDDLLVMTKRNDEQSDGHSSDNEYRYNTARGLQWADIGCLTVDDVGIMSLAEMLFNYVYHNLTCSGKDVKSLQKKLLHFASQANGLQVIASCLAFIPAGIQQLSQAGPVHKFLLNFLEGYLCNTSVAANFWQLPLRILSRVSFKYDSILNMHLNHLLGWGQHMIPVISLQQCGNTRTKSCQVYQWRYKTSNEMTQGGLDNLERAKTFEALVEHFRALTDGPDYVKRRCRNAIQDVQREALLSCGSNKLGASIWADLEKALL
ncbi:uncharacterized protein LOC5516489 [Nematostella vectensis]|uniref:uncharacterized protein LOC5516489 n=1 Tax=Nematostella vectensis TaxID=45351 RepID=UPI00207779A0|nr:uncharacterized protein LOC5516489 [Nematostella vectensis]